MANEPITPPQKNANYAPSSSAFRTYAQDLASLGGKAAQVVPPRRTPPPSVKAYSVPPPPPPPAYIIPKAPSTTETREDVLDRLRTVATEAVPPVPPLPQMEGQVIPKAPSTLESREAILARLRKSASTINRMETPSAPPAPAEEPTTPLNAPIHTYKTDFADRIDAKKASTFSVLAAQSDSTSAPTGRIKERGRFPIALVTGLLLIALGGGALFYAYSSVTKEPVIPSIINVPSLIFADERAKLEGTGPELMSALALSASSALPDGSVRVTYTAFATTSPEGVFTETPLAGGALIAALSLPAPEILIRNVEPSSTVGVVHAGPETRAFFILKVSSYERTFAGMLEWEPRIANDLAVLYPLYPQEVVSTSTPAVVALSSFSDEILENRDVRVLRDTTGRSLLLYGYRDKETLIIARDEAAFSELLQRLSTSRGQ